MKIGLEEPNISVNSFEIEDNVNLLNEMSNKQINETEKKEKFESNENIMNPFKSYKNYLVDETIPNKKISEMEKNEKFEINDNTNMHHFISDKNYKGEKNDKLGTAAKLETQDKSSRDELLNEISDKSNKINDKQERTMETERSQKSEKNEKKSNNEKKPNYQSKPTKLFVKEDVAVFLRYISKDMEEFIEILSEEDLGEEEKGYFIVKINKIRRDLDRIEVIESDERDIRKALEEKNKEITDLQKEIEILKAELSKYQKDSSKNQSENENLKIKLGDTRSELAKLTSELMKCMGEKDEMIKKLANENEDLSKKVKATEKEKEELEKKFEDSLNKFKKELQYNFFLGSVFLFLFILKKKDKTNRFRINRKTTKIRFRKRDFANEAGYGNKKAKERG